MRTRRSRARSTATMTPIAGKREHDRRKNPESHRVLRICEVVGAGHHEHVDTRMQGTEVVDEG